jgi:hypothetical protein
MLFRGLNASYRRTPSLHTEVFLDVLCEGIVDFGMTLHGLFLAGRRVEIDIVPCSVSVKNTTRFGQLSDQFGTLHREISFIW